MKQQTLEIPQKEDKLGLPQSWRWVRLGDHVKKVGSGITPRGGQASYQKSGIPLMRSQNVHMNRFVAERIAFISPEQDEQMEGSRVLPGDILLNITGASIGRVCVVPQEVCPANVNQHVSIIRGDGSFDPAFISYFLSTPDFQKHILDSQAGATRQALTKTLIEDFRIPLPPLPEQQRIAVLLHEQMATVERAGVAAQAQLEAARALPTAYLRSVFSSPEVQKWPKRSIREWRKLGYISDIQDGNHGELHPRANEYTEIGIPFIMANNIRDNFLDLNKCHFISQQRGKTLRVGFSKKNDVLLSHKGSIGFTAVVSYDESFIILTPQLTYYRANLDKLSPYFLYYNFRSEAFQSQLNKISRQATRAYVGISAQENLEISIPDLSEQKRLSSLLSSQLESINPLKEAAEKQTKIINALPAALLRRAFNGEL